MNARKVIARLLDVMRRSEPERLAPGEAAPSGDEWDAAERAAASHLHFTAETDNIVPANPNRAWPELSACPVCGHAASMQRRIGGALVDDAFLVCCERKGAIHPDDDPEIGGLCVMDLPPACFYHETARAAANYWNSYAAALVKLRAEPGSRS
jgi:hypothetical protein